MTLLSSIHNPITASSTKILYESNADTNALTDAEKNDLHAPGSDDQDLTALEAHLPRSHATAHSGLGLEVAGHDVTNVNEELAPSAGQKLLGFEADLVTPLVVDVDKLGGAWDKSGHTQGVVEKLFLVGTDVIPIFDSENAKLPAFISLATLAAYLGTVPTTPNAEYNFFPIYYFNNRYFPTNFFNL